MSKIATRDESTEIRVLTDAELDHVSGGFAVVPFIVGIAVGALVQKPVETVLDEAGVYKASMSPKQIEAHLKSKSGRPA
jgi:hypothetical protein